MHYIFPKPLRLTSSKLLAYATTAATTVRMMASAASPRVAGQPRASAVSSMAGWPAGRLAEWPHNRPDMSQSNASSSNDDLSTITTKYSDDISRTKDNMEKGKRNGRKNKKKGGASKAEKEREKKMKKREAMKMHYSRKSDEEKKEVSRKNNNQARLRRAGENPDQQSLVQAEVNSKRRRIYAANVDAKLWNDKFPYDKIADNQRDRNETEKVVVFGMETSLHLRIPERVKTMTQHLPYVRDGLGHCDEGGHFVETTGASLVRVAKAVDRAIFHGDVRNRCLVSLDAGSGNGYPSMVFSQLFDKGVPPSVRSCARVLLPTR
ncbi:hypothetical protein THAOC_08436 [Thalassiosira oceanica]|uniref:Uncharacterized protein n=1 Tax=Thalassiosira oceanica TaxID=159749 RepID=K0SXY3_THAOC|nr:hypothetical protein THAOC_08436 [Thalassiosira oceanica]|eukprot:EJK70220.1 hypothetical protein THAOC_08436 [Thalassiosira oceanica]